MDGSDVTDHIAKVLEIIEWIEIPNVDKDELRLHVFSKSLSGNADKWWNNEGTTTTWKELGDLAVKKSMICYEAPLRPTSLPEYPTRDFTMSTSSLLAEKTVYMSLKLVSDTKLNVES
ncbi:hypothetical protein Tco_1006353 [Tanacetum coccineum]|uniref:Retrotransposon gag domain-containing protein n=1 Tax=Tanacetum coccineum TaxID=301880 RepID=A0ABQ5FIQ4_9ASTR